MPAFLVADETITDPDGFEEYKLAVLPLIERYGDRFLSRGGDLKVLESGKVWEPDRMVIIEFPSMTSLEERYGSDEYAAVRDIRLRSASSTLVALHSGSAEKSPRV